MYFDNCLLRELQAREDRCGASSVHRSRKVT